MRGFTLLEMLLVIAILGIIGAFALPSYQDYVRRGNRTTAKTAVMEIAARQESFFTDRKQYATSLSGLGYAANTLYVGRDARLTASSANALYSVTLVGYTAGSIANCSGSGSSTATSFAVVATPLGAQTKDRCGKICIGSEGTKGAASTSASECWRR